MTERRQPRLGDRHYHVEPVPDTDDWAVWCTVVTNLQPFSLRYLRMCTTSYKDAEYTATRIADMFTRAAVPTQPGHHMAWPVYVLADCEGRTSKVVAWFSSVDEARVFADSSVCRNLHAAETQERGTVGQPITIYRAAVAYVNPKDHA